MAGDHLWALFFGVLDNLIGVIQIWQNRRRDRAKGARELPQESHRQLKGDGIMLVLVRVCTRYGGGVPRRVHPGLMKETIWDCFLEVIVLPNFGTHKTSRAWRGVGRRGSSNIGVEVISDVEERCGWWKARTNAH
ncbi:hypothetical protein LTR20_004121 [Exophiala xenobiotica]|uniref:Uncharacterized protein n=1 Tax=Vermiconidia calcicola TaxID=1690605 RepID=A0AAV9Q4R1_9PEZI|nr:hypothetical protein LTR06_003562 [Exophiala xenobiotica]KAK5535846.1 hypothetical protein LTR25_005748 [Vermiconidia calcicola]KAK5548786.1 hypothetical protein LTR23_001275 [Chaetothyriales sp. CCFEE 6169]KAK5465703.1 hypothetical protein LTR20_004121 [Exophiala xenobiotica]KAK5480405.1 hypothetical protein LTR83_010255 [Exophiala xenobiotica]